MKISIHTFLRSWQLLSWWRHPPPHGLRRFIVVFKRAQNWILSQWNPFQPCFFKIHFNIIITSTPRSPEWSLPFSYVCRAAGLSVWYRGTIELGETSSPCANCFELFWLMALSGASALPEPSSDNWKWPTDSTCHNSETRFCGMWMFVTCIGCMGMWMMTWKRLRINGLEVFLYLTECFRLTGLEVFLYLPECFRLTIQPTDPPLRHATDWLPSKPTHLDVVASLRRWYSHDKGIPSHTNLWITDSRLKCRQFGLRDK
jgi:hypothetical protein